MRSDKARIRHSGEDRLSCPGEIQVSQSSKPIG
jgi:hypothetical protein